MVILVWIGYSCGQSVFTFLLLLLDLLFKLRNDVFEVEKPGNCLSFALYFRLCLPLWLFGLRDPTIRVSCLRIILLSRVAVLSFRPWQELRSLILHFLCVVGLYFLDLLSDIDIAIVVQDYSIAQLLPCLHKIISCVVIVQVVDLANSCALLVLLAGRWALGSTERCLHREDVRVLELLPQGDASGLLLVPLDLESRVVIGEEVSWDLGHQVGENTISFRGLAIRISIHEHILPTAMTVQVTEKY